MCGIAGVYSANRARAIESVGAMNQAQTHRGPDDAGLKTLEVGPGTLVLGHRRLSILDLSPAGHQPMENPETGDWIVFNGEIYNFPALRAELEAAGSRFRSHCDTEVILHAYARWGTDAFDRLHGMFALALLDQSEGRLILARDSLGIKPLYYTQTQDAFLFASELRAIRASGQVECAVDRRALGSLLAYGAVAAPLTLFRDVRVLSPGTWAALDLVGGLPADRPLREVRYWDFPSTAGFENRPKVLADEISERLATAVRSHLMSDVPVGVFLSSGLDSTAIAAHCAEARGGDVDTFTVAFAEDPDLDEGPIARRTADLFGVRHHRIELTEAATRERTRQFLESIDQPSLDGLNTYIIAQAVRERGIIVALSGLGGDEIFCGYSTFRDVPWQTRTLRALRMLPRPARMALARRAWRNKPKVQRQKAVETIGAGATLSDVYFRRRRLLSDAELSALGFHADELDLDPNFLPPESEPGRSLPRSDPAASVGVLECRYYMGNMLLRDTDVFSMAHSLEIRVPLLDRRLIDLLLSVPASVRLARPKGGPNKPRLVDAVARHLRPELLDQKKRGFSLPQARWMAGPLRDQFEDLLEAARSSGLIDPAGVDAVWTDFLAEPKGSAWSRAWMLGVIGAGLRTRPAPSCSPH